MEQVADVAAHYGKDTLLAKIDIEPATASPQFTRMTDWWQAVQRKGDMYIDTMLPFGLRLAPKFFDTLECYLGHKVIFHY